MSRRWLIAVSSLAHLAVAVGLFLSGVWRMDRLDVGHVRIVDITFRPPPPPAPSGGPEGPKPPDMTPKPLKPVPAKGTHQPKPKPDQPLPPDTGTGETTGPGKGPGDITDIGTCTENCVDTTTVSAPVCGDGSRDVTEQCDDGNTADGDGCSATCRTEAPKPKPPSLVPPTVLQGLRVSGETQLHPSDVTLNMMIRDGATSARGVVLVCIGGNGSVASATMQVSTKYAAYDATILSAVRDWHYRPYLLNSTPVPACSTVTFLYSIK